MILPGVSMRGQRKLSRVHGRVALAVVAGLLAAAVPAQAAKPLRVKGGQLVDSQGRTVILHGVNVVFKRPPYVPNGRAERTSFNARDVARLRSWGFNTVRLGLSWKALMPTPGVVDQAYLKRVLAITRLLEEEGIFYLLDMHQDMWSERFEGNGAPDWATKDDGIAFTSLGGFPLNYAAPAVGRSFTNFYENRDGIRDQYRRAWEAVARAVRGKPYALGFDLMNEPSCELQVDPPCHIPPAAEAYSRWLLPFYDDLVPALKRADPTHPSFYEEGVTVNFGYPTQIGRAPLPAWKHRGTVLSHHVYCSTAFRSVPCSQQEPDAFREARESTKRNGVAALVTEFGATEDLAVLRRVVNLADRNGEGWQYWQYKTYDDPTTSASAESGGPDAESIVDVRGKVKRSKLRVLARVFPQRIAGSGATWSFDDRTHVFRMSWNATKGTTVIALPRVHFPRGARVNMGAGHDGVAFEDGRDHVNVTERGRVSVRLSPR
jgi:endoglycosylceramidase